ncbi:MAG: transposase, partial [Planctomycetota bacterium]
MDLTHEQWQRIAEYIPKPKAQPGKSGRPPQDCRAVLNGILWILRTGAPWGDLPERYPPKSTCHRRFQDTDGTGPRPKRPRRDRPERGFHRRNLCSGKKRGDGVGKTKKGKGTKIMGLTDAFGLPIAIDATSANPHEVTLVDKTLDACFLEHVPEKVIGDRAYDSDKLDQKLAEERGVDLI